MSKIVKFYNGNLIECEIYKLVDFYDPILREPTVPWNHFDHEPKESEYLAFSLAETLKQYGGLGLSANQVGLKHRICVINMGSEIWTMFNPVILEHNEVLADYSEGCLSYPGLYLKLNRPDHIKVRFQATNGEFLEKEMDGLTAVCVQHELDHLDGIVYTDKVSPIKLEQAKRKVKQNLKKIRNYIREREKYLDAEEKETVTPIEMEKPEIKIIPPETLQKKEPEKFVYKAG